MQICPNCREENPDRFRLCGFCGTPLAAPTAPQETRKTVTIVFSDLKGSTQLGERLESEALREVLSVYFEEMKRVLEAHGGTVEKYIGDAVMAVFGLPRLHEDDALRAVRAATAMQEALVRVNEQLANEWGVTLQNRTGVNTGEVVAGDPIGGQRLVTGDAVNVAARLEQAAPAMEILVGESTYRLVKEAVEVEPVEPLELKGKSERVPAYQLLGVRGEEAVPRRLNAPMVGRASELRTLLDAFELTSRQRRPSLVTVIGPAGVGKTRLLREFAEGCSLPVRILRGRCLSYGDGITFWPIREIVREAAGVGDDEPAPMAQAKIADLTGDVALAARVASAVGLTSEAFTREEIFWGVRRLLETLAEREPTVIVFEDIHWAEPTFLDLIEHIVAAAQAVPLTMVCTARAELLETRPDWESTTGGRLLSLRPLNEDESVLVIQNQLGTTDLDATIRRRISDAAQGNPLYVEQMLSMLIDDGTLAKDEDGRWVLRSDPGDVIVPPSISALLSARLDRLSHEERAVLERASVIGQIFYPRAVEAMAPELADRVGACLLALAKKELIERHESSLSEEEAYAFSHILIRDASYRGLLKRARADLHERFVAWLEDVLGGRALEFEEIRGYHLEQAFLSVRDLGPLDSRARAIGERASRYLASAGRRALDREDVPAAATLLERAAAVLDERDESRSMLLLDLGEALTDLGEFGRAGDVLVEVVGDAVERGDEGLSTNASIARLHLSYSTAPEETSEIVLQVAHGAVLQLDALGDHVGLAKAWRLIAQVEGTSCRFAAAAEAGHQVVEHARLAGEKRLENRALPGLALCAAYGPTPVPEAIRECERVLLEAAGDRAAEALTLCALANLEAMDENFDRARELYRRSRATLEELGFRRLTVLTSIDSGSVELLAGDAEAAEGELRPDLEALHEMGERNYVATVSALLSHAVYRQGRFEEAERLAAESRDVVADDDIETQALWRSALAKVLARRGVFDEAEKLARQAVDLIATTDELVSYGNALLDLAEVLMLADDAGAKDATLDALQCFERKRSTASIRRARAIAEALDTGTRAEFLSPARSSDGPSPAGTT